MSYLTNPYMVTPSSASWMDDSKLMAYWKFNESSGNIGNSSQSSDSLGSDGDLIMTGGTYEQSAPLGSSNSVLFDGIDDFSQASSGSNTLSQFNFIHENQSTICFWMQLVAFHASSLYQLPFVNNDWSSNAGSIWLITKDAPCGTGCGTLSQEVFNGTNSIVDGIPSSGNSAYIPDVSDFYFYVVRLDCDITTDTVIWNRGDTANNYGNEIKGDRNNAPIDGDSPSPLTIARRSNASQFFSNIYLSEYSIWNRILSDPEVAGLYNEGNSRAIYE